MVQAALTHERDTFIHGSDRCRVHLAADVVGFVQQQHGTPHAGGLDGGACSTRASTCDNDVIATLQLSGGHCGQRFGRQCLCGFQRQCRHEVIEHRRHVATVAGFFGDGILGPVIRHADDVMLHHHCNGFVNGARVLENSGRVDQQGRDFGTIALATSDEVLRPVLRIANDLQFGQQGNVMLRRFRLHIDGVSQGAEAKEGEAGKSAAHEEHPTNLKLGWRARNTFAKWRGTAVLVNRPRMLWTSRPDACKQRRVPLYLLHVPARSCSSPSFCAAALAHGLAATDTGGDGHDADADLPWRHPVVLR